MKTNSAQRDTQAKAGMAMPKSDSKPRTAKTPGEKPAFKDAIALLKKDHREVEKAFAKFEKMSEDDHADKKQLADHICNELSKHMTIEEEIFYPAVKDEAKDAEEIVNEGVVEHAEAKSLMKQIAGMKGKEELFDTKVMVLKEMIEHHVEEEEKEMFPKAEKSKLDLEALGEKMAQHKSKLN